MESSEKSVIKWNWMSIKVYHREKYVVLEMEGGIYLYIKVWQWNYIMI